MILKWWLKTGLTTDTSALGCDGPVMMKVKKASSTVKMIQMKVSGHPAFAFIDFYKSA